MHESRTRRWFLAAGGAVTATVAACRSKGPAAPVEPRALGAGISPYGSRSHFEKSSRFFRPTTIPEEASSRTPLQDTCGMITPSSLHFERHHAGVPDIDPATHTLTIHGMVDRPIGVHGRRAEAAALDFPHLFPRVLGQQRERMARSRARRRAARARVDELQRVDRRAGCRCCSKDAACDPERDVGARPRAPTRASSRAASR